MPHEDNCQTPLFHRSIPFILPQRCNLASYLGESQDNFHIRFNGKLECDGAVGYAACSCGLHKLEYVCLSLDRGGTYMDEEDFSSGIFLPSTQARNHRFNCLRMQSRRGMNHHCPVASAASHTQR